MAALFFAGNMKWVSKIYSICSMNFGVIKYKKYGREKYGIA